MSIVKCVYCQERFDKDKTEYKLVSSRRYAHLNCEKPAIDANGVAYQTIIQYSREILGETANVKKIAKQIKDFISKGLKYQGIYLTLKYWYEIEKNSIEKANGGIGIVPFVYRDAEKYWKSMSPKRTPKIEQEEVIIRYKKREKIKIGRE